jgi:hypothetical protein
MVWGGLRIAVIVDVYAQPITLHFSSLSLLEGDLEGVEKNL